MVSRDAFTLDDFDVLVLFSLEAVLLSWTKMVMRSPRPRARLSANMERAVSSFHNEPGLARAPRGNQQPTSAAGQIQPSHEQTRDRNAPLQVDEDGLFITDFSIKFTLGFGVADAHQLAG